MQLCETKRSLCEPMCNLSMLISAAAPRAPHASACFGVARAFARPLESQKAAPGCLVVSFPTAQVSDHLRVRTGSASSVCLGASAPMTD